MNAIVEKALALWGMPNAEYSLVAARENEVFKVTQNNEICALRLHRIAYRTDQELASELHWMEIASQNGIKVPTPISNALGEFLATIDGVQVDALDWLSGAPLSGVYLDLSTRERTSIFQKIGAEMAQLHKVSDTATFPENFTRCVWDREGLVGDTPLWDRFWMNPILEAVDQVLFADFRTAANDVLSKFEGSLDYGLIHADLVAANVMIDGEDIRLIDFDDGGFGFRLFDIATTLLKFMDEPDYGALSSALVNGYFSVRTLDLEHLDLFLALRAMSYVGWNMTRMDEEYGRERNTRFIDTARTLAQSYLN